jgi:hypothetical protein
MENIQELIRIVDATLGKVSSNGLNTGKTAIQFIKFLTEVEDMKKFVGDDFFNQMVNQVNDSKDLANTRGQVKKILMYPKFKYDPWIPVAIKNERLDLIHKELSSIEFTIKVKDGKIYGVPSENISDVIYKQLSEFIPESFQINSESSHITIINSDVVASIGIDKINQIVARYQDTFYLQFGNVKSTTSVFSECCVIEISSTYIQTFLSDINEKLSLNLKPSTHITFATTPRSLF